MSQKPGVWPRDDGKWVVQFRCKCKTLGQQRKFDSRDVAEAVLAEHLASAVHCRAEESKAALEGTADRVMATLSW